MVPWAKGHCSLTLRQGVGDLAALEELEAPVVWSFDDGQTWRLAARSGEVPAAMEQKGARIGHSARSLMPDIHTAADRGAIQVSHFLNLPSHQVTKSLSTYLIHRILVRNNMPSPHLTARPSSEHLWRLSALASSLLERNFRIIPLSLCCRSAGARC